MSLFLGTPLPIFILRPSTILIAFVAMLLAFSTPTKVDVPLKHFIVSGRAQGTTYTIKYLYPDSLFLQDKVDSLLLVVDNSLSLYKTTSSISKFNASLRGTPIDIHLLHVVSASLGFSAETLNAFDITSKPISLLWGFNGPTPSTPPGPLQLASVLKHVGPHHISIRNDSLLKDDPHTMIDCDGVAQGYTVDQLSQFLLSLGIKDFMVELGGEVRTSGKSFDGKHWIIGLEDPSASFGTNSIVSKRVSLSGLAITTSGSLKKFKRLGNAYFSHIMDPRTGRPINNGIVSVTVIARDAITADAYDNAVMVFGIQQSFSRFGADPSIGFHIVYTKADGSLADTSNLRFKDFLLN